MISVIIADDHPVVRSGLKQIMAETGEIVIADEASTGCELLAKAAMHHFDVVLLDISMPDKDGLETLKELRAQKPDLPVLVLTMYPEEQYAVRMLKAGAAGYLTKRQAPQELIVAIRKVSEGGKYVSATLAEQLAGELQIDPQKPLHEALSDREYQVLCLIGSGKTPTQIAREINLSVKTISTYRSRILDKMKMKTNAELTVHVVRNRLVE